MADAADRGRWFESRSDNFIWNYNELVPEIKSNEQFTRKRNVAQDLGPYTQSTQEDKGLRQRINL